METVNSLANAQTVGLVSFNYINILFFVAFASRILFFNFSKFFPGKLCTERITGYAESIDQCQDQPCHNGGTCESGPGWFRCVCAQGFSGPDCRINVNECSPQPCLGGAKCIDGIGGFTCICPKGRRGSRCEIRKFTAFVFLVEWTLNFIKSFEFVQFYQIHLRFVWIPHHYHHIVQSMRANSENMLTTNTVAIHAFVQMEKQNARIFGAVWKIVWPRTWQMCAPRTKYVCQRCMKVACIHRVNHVVIVAYWNVQDALHHPSFPHPLNVGQIRQYWMNNALVSQFWWKTKRYSRPHLWKEFALICVRCWVRNWWKPCRMQHHRCWYYFVISKVERMIPSKSQWWVKRSITFLFCGCWNSKLKLCIFLSFTVIEYEPCSIHFGCCDSSGGIIVKRK